MVEKRIVEVLNTFRPISLEEMVSVRLMNRTDTKFITSPLLLETLLEEMVDSYYVQEIENKRLSEYQTLYLDTRNMDMYLAHQNGRKKREKIRVRRYKETGQTFFEVKDKDNKGRTHKSRVELFRDYKESQQIPDFMHAKSRFRLEDISPCVESCFQRITLVNKEMTERLTIDLHLQFHNLRTGFSSKTRNLAIIELKRDGNIPSVAKELLNKHRIRPANISKYCFGSVLTTPGLKHNRFKSKLIQINKLTQ